MSSLPPDSLRQALGVCFAPGGSLTMLWGWGMKGAHFLPSGFSQPGDSGRESSASTDVESMSAFEKFPPYFPITKQGSSHLDGLYCSSVVPPWTGGGSTAAVRQRPQVGPAASGRWTPGSQGAATSLLSAVASGQPAHVWAA